MYFPRTLIKVMTLIGKGTSWVVFRHCERCATIPVAMTVLLLTFSGCNSGTTLAHIDDERVSLIDFVIRLSQVPGFSNADPKQQRASARSIMESLVDDRALCIEAKAKGLTVSASQVDHALRQHEALLGPTLLKIYTHQRGVSRKVLWDAYEQQLLVLEYLKFIQIKEKPFCDGFGVQSLQNCVMRRDFMKTVRERHSVRVNEEALMQVLDDLVGKA